MTRNPFTGRPTYWILDDNNIPQPSTSQGVYEWELSMSDEEFMEKRTVSKDRITVGSKEYLVSTVFLPIDHSHSFGRSGRHLYETMIFDQTSLEEDDLGDSVYCDRYPTRGQASRGHQKIIEGLKEGTLEIDDE